MGSAERLLSGAVQAAADIGHMFDFIITEDDESLLVATFLNGREPPPDAFVGRSCGALGTRVSWSPDDVQPFKQVWAIVAVATSEPAEAVIGPYDGDWYRIPTLDLPWFMASTAGGIRSSIEKGEPLVFKQGGDPSLFGRVADSPPPPTDEHGRI